MRIGAWLAAILVSQAVQAGPLPESFTFARYQAIAAHSPFAISPADTPPASTSFLYLATAARLFGVQQVTVESRTDPSFKLRLSSAEQRVEWQLVSVAWSETPCETTATIARDGVSAVIRFQDYCITDPLR